MLGLSGCALLYVLLTGQHQFALAAVAAITPGLMLMGVGFRKVRHHQPRQPDPTTPELRIPVAVMGMLVAGSTLVAFSVLGAGVLVLFHVVADSAGQPRPTWSPFPLAWVLLVVVVLLIAGWITYSIAQRAESRAETKRHRSN